MRDVIGGATFGFLVVAFVFVMVGQHEKKPTPPPPPRTYVQHFPAIGETLVLVGGDRPWLMWVGRDSIFQSRPIDQDSLLKLARPF